MTINPMKYLPAEIRRVAEAEAQRMVIQMWAAGASFTDRDWIACYIADALEDAYKHVKNWES